VLIQKGRGKEKKKGGAEVFSLKLPGKEKQCNLGRSKEHYKKRARGPFIQNTKALAQGMRV